MYDPNDPFEYLAQVYYEKNGTYPVGDPRNGPVEFEYDENGIDYENLEDRPW